ncbi:MAG TPA: DUF1206 domain-containing protein [Acidimicrobiales bacterium]|nr:DUF1206 domain-containing protein [Acidimicrobiales bacterium]
MKATELVPEEVERAKSRPAFQRLARAGIATRAIIYSLLAFMTADIAFTHQSPSAPSGAGALDVIAKVPAGRALLGFLAVGFLAYAAWRAVQVLSPGDRPKAAGANGPRAGGAGTQADIEIQEPRRPPTTATHTAQEAAGAFERVGWGSISVLYAALCYQAVSLALGSASDAGGGASSHPQPLVATVLRWPLGAGWVGLGGTGIAAGGIGLAVWGCARDYSKTFDRQRLEGTRYQSLRVTGIVGEITRGVLITLVAVYLLVAAATDDPSHAKSLGGALYSLDRLPLGPPVLVLTAAGLACFAAFSVFEALYRQI